MRRDAGEVCGFSVGEEDRTGGGGGGMGFSVNGGVGRGGSLIWGMEGSAGGCGGGAAF